MNTMSSFLERNLPTIRIATWNILAKEQGRSNRLNTIIETLYPLDLDVICLQECWSGAEVEIARALGMNSVAFYEAKNGGGFGNAVLSRFPLATEAPIEYAALPSTGGDSNEVCLVALSLLSPSGRMWRIGSTHLSWGSHNEGKRLRQIQDIERLARQADLHSTSDLIHVLCGDLNAQPHSSTIRYITGLDPDRNDESTLWVDAWDTAEKAPGYTSSNENPMGIDTALSVGISNPAWIPNRRIDYILTRGFAYGRPGSPISVKLLDRPYLGEYGSDHYGIVANLWDPQVSSSEALK